MEDGYIRGNKIGVKGFYSQRKLHFRDYGGPQCYNPIINNPKKGTGIVTDYICDICCSLDGIFSRNRIKNNCDVGGKNHLWYASTTVKSISKFQYRRGEAMK